ncbi:EAL domain-containing protein [Bacillus sp. OK048]|uniref:EAL domain-containing protein n=1 Tax=Bacillus sp. OK048 TaxID=1882761 RepID=UPI00087F9276|nr:EAL domain-containing protein [Bacillus sp. OK048]SDM60013.1 PAS domain S-box-containing protein/diguanylate cyclase (GGDEF) domain-containing protein [Bacillus sp. OK048]
MRNWFVDQAHSTVGFEVKHMMVSKVRGQFDSFTADVEAEDLTDLTTAKIVFKFDVDSINTRNLERDKHLKSVDFFDIQNYPTIDFKSTKITKSRDRYKVTGDVTIKGITKLVTFDVAFGGKGTDPEGVEVYGYEAEATINREEFGLTWNAALETGGVLVGKEVKIKVELELNQQYSAFSKTSSLEKKSLFENKLLKQEITSNEIHRMIAENVTDLVSIIDRNGVIHYVSPSFKTVLNYDLPLLEKTNIFEKIQEDDQKTVKNEILSYCGRTLKRALKSEFRLLHEEGYYIDVEADIVGINEPSFSKNELMLVVMRDISERKEVQKAIYQLAFHDSLTNLPNRRSFMNQLCSEVMDRKLPKSKLSIFFIDLDNFKQINDQWGHDAGDLVLKEAAKRIQSVIRPADIAARIGGDEFVVMLKDVQDEQYATTIVQRMIEQFQTPIKDGEQEYTLTCSIGVAHYPDHGESPEDLIKNADTALYYVKERGKNDFMVFNQLMEHQSLERRLLENALRQGINEHQFYLEYQPKVNLSTNELIGMEALVRWNHPDLGIIPPGKFIPLAEETGLIVPLGEWILRESCRQASAWQDQGYPPLLLSVNVSVRQLEDINFVDKVKTILHETGLDPKWLEFEITESVLANVKSTVSILKEIRNLGIHISVDDFGTGYSSLSYIKELPIDTLKIDQSFVKDIHTNKESKEIAKAIINLAKSIGLTVIAEGIERKEHVDELSNDGYVQGQGYYYSRPLKPSAFEDFMTSNHEAS